jgi:hypothetical protein
MAHAKQASKRKRRRVAALPILGAAGMSLAMAGGASATVPIANVPSQDNELLSVITLDEEEISDVTLATFYVFDKEGLGTSGLVEKVARRCGGCGGARGCRGCAARACRGCAARAYRGCARSSEVAEAAEAAEAGEPAEAVVAEAAESAGNGPEWAGSVSASFGRTQAQTLTPNEGRLCSTSPAAADVLVSNRRMPRQRNDARPAIPITPRALHVTERHTSRDFRVTRLHAQV